jgi:hypothetical protein
MECGMMKQAFLSVWISGLFLCFSCLVSGMVLDQLTDPVDTCLAPYLDIVEARVESEGGDLTFIMRMRGTLPTLLTSSDDTLVFLWLIDADHNSDTGQSWGTLGADFKVAAKIGQNNGGGFVDVLGSIPGGGRGTMTLVGDTIRVTIHAGQIGFPKEFDWRVASVALLDSWFVAGNAISAQGSTVVLPNIPPSRIEVFPPLLCLSPTGQSMGQLSVLLYDEYGLQLPADRYTVQFRSSDPALASVDSAGMVSVQPGSTECDRPAWISAAVEGLESVNQVLIRGMNGPLPTRHRLWSQDHIVLYMPLETAGSDLERFVDSIRAADLMEEVYRNQKSLSGTVIYQDGTQYLVVDGENCTNPIPCKTGNPIRLNWQPGLVPPAGTGTQGTNPSRISWVRVFHDMGHNFLVPSVTFQQVTATSSPNHNTAYSEALATAEAIWSRYRLIRCGGRLEQPIRETIEREYTLREQDCRDHLAAYIANGAAYDLLDADILAGILYELHDEFGNKVWFDLFSTLLPEQETFPVEIATPQQQAAWFVAALSASTGQDLRERFEIRYGFAIDPEVWRAALLAAQKRIAARPWQADNPADLNCDQLVWLDDLWQMAEHWMQADCVGPWWCGSSDLDHNGRVDLSDMDPVANQWLWSNCPPLKPR